MSKKHIHLVLDSEDALKLRLLSAVYEDNMSGVVTKLVQTAYESNTESITPKVKRKVGQIIKRWRP